MTLDPLARWIEWLADDAIFDDIATLHHNRRMFRGLREVAADNERVGGSLLWGWMVHNYMIAQALGVRRQTETRETVRTLGRLIYEPQQHPELATRQAHVDAALKTLHPNSPIKDHIAAEAAAEFERDYGGNVREHLDPGLPGGDLARLQWTARSIREHVNKHLAHADKKAKPPMATLDELDAAIDLLSELYIKYASLLRHVGWIGEISDELPDDWDVILRAPWIVPSDPGV